MENVNKNRMVDVSVIIVNYNGIDLLRGCLSSLEKFTSNLNYEVIVVDNNSTDGDIAEIVNNYQNACLIKNSKNLGYAVANNIGAERAEGKYLLILNNDIIFIENSIKKVFDFVENKSGEVVVGCRLLNKDKSNQVSISAFPTVLNTLTENIFIYKLFPKSKLLNKYYLNYLDIKDTSEVDVVKGAFMFCTKKNYFDLDGFDERFYFYSEETDFCYRFKKGKGEILFYPFTSIIHLGGATTSADLWFKYKNQCIAKIQLYQKHFKGIKFLIAVLSHYLGLLLRSFFYLIGGVISVKKSLIVKSYYFCRQFFVYPKNVFPS
ncbi:MAG TPA: glycosyltransferase family 2 protein [Ignavibacteriaceae bacterium]|nr:glycosyltransferase family 2 protein [Ignavibacteriaceae bacterium]